MLLTDMDMRSPDRPLEHGPERFKSVHVAIAFGPLLRAVFNGIVLVAETGKNAVRQPFIGADARTLGNLTGDFGNEGLARGVGNDLGVNLAAVALKDTEYNRLARSAAPALTLPLAADIGFIGFNMARQRRLAVNLAHVFADQVRHAEGGRIGHAQLALQFLGRNAVARSGEQVHRIEPLLQRNAGPLEHRSDHRMNVVAAPLAGIGRHLLKAGPAAFLAALLALKRFAVTQLHKVVKASVVVRELLKEIGDGRGVCHSFLLSMVKG